MKKCTIILFILLHLAIPVLARAESSNIGIRMEKSSEILKTWQNNPYNNSIGFDLNTYYRAGFLKGRLAAKDSPHTVGWFAITTIYLSVAFASRFYPATAGALLFPILFNLVHVEPNSEELFLVKFYNDDYKRGFFDGYNDKIHEDMKTGWGIGVLLTSVVLVFVYLGTDNLE